MTLSCNKVTIRCGDKPQRIFFFRFLLGIQELGHFRKSNCITVMGGILAVFPKHNHISH